ncbi:MAG: acyl-CoA dehydrogenase family protein [Cyanobacteria bacterium J06642_2]
MDFSWSAEQLEYRQKVIEFARAHLNGDIIERDLEGKFSWENWQCCADFGIQGLCVPETYSGSSALDIMTAVLAMEGLGYGCEDNGLTLALNAQMWTVQVLILQFGTEEQKQRYLPRLCSGEWIGAHALSEPESGSDVYGMQTIAKKCDGGYLLTGTKKFVTCAPIANLALTFATLDPNLGKWGVTAFLVERSSPGYSTSPTRQKMGLRTTPFGEITFENCFVPEANRLGPEGAGFSFSNHSLEYDRCFNLASELGAMERQLERTIDYARSRHQYGQSIGKFQSVSNRIADMKLRLETARLLLYKVAWLKESGKPAMLDAALLKLYLSECFVASGLDAIRVHGGNGYLTDVGIERDLRDAVGGVIYAGTSDIQRNIIARSLGL